jgi:hypothetical protein
MGSSESRSYFATAARASRGGASRRARREPARSGNKRSEQDLAVDPVVDHHYE